MVFGGQALNWRPCSSFHICRMVDKVELHKIYSVIWMS